MYLAPSLDEFKCTVDRSFSKVLTWLHANRLSLSVPKTYYQLYAPNHHGVDLQIKAGDLFIKRACTVKYLGILIDEDMKFRSHIIKLSSTVSRNVGIISRARYLLNKELATLLYNALVLPCLNYCLVVWGSNYNSNLQSLVIAQKRAIRVVAGAGRLSHTSPIFRELKILKLQDLLKYHLLLILHDCLFGHLPSIMSNKLFFLIEPVQPDETSILARQYNQKTDQSHRTIAIIIIVYSRSFAKRLEYGTTLWPQKWQTSRISLAARLSLRNVSLIFTYEY